MRRAVGMVDHCWDPVQHLEEEPQLEEARGEGWTLEETQTQGPGCS